MTPITEKITQATDFAHLSENHVIGVITSVIYLRCIFGQTINFAS